jgi:hypothetical protein
MARAPGQPRSIVAGLYLQWPTLASHAFLTGRWGPAQSSSAARGLFFSLLLTTGTGMIGRQRGASQLAGDMQRGQGRQTPQAATERATR